MKFFSRSKILRKVMIALCLIWGFIMLLGVIDVIRSSPLTSDDPLRFYIPLGFTVLAILVIIAVVLSVIIKDAEEDLGAIKKYLKEND